MKVYINKIVTFSNLGICPVDKEFLESGCLMDNLSSQKVLQIKGLKKIPRHYKAFLVVADVVLKSIECNSKRIGIINSYEISNLDPTIDFENEMKLFGDSWVDPIKGPFTVGNACSGWIAIMCHIPYLNLTVNAGKNSIFSSLNVARNEILLDGIDASIILSGNFYKSNFNVYSKFEQSDTVVSEFANAILLSKTELPASIAEIISISNHTYTSEHDIIEFINNNTDNEFSFVDGWNQPCVNNIVSLNGLVNNRKQFSFFPLFVGNLSNQMRELNLNRSDIINYISIDQEKNMQSCIKLRLL